MESNKRYRKACRARFTKNANELEKLLSAADKVAQPIKEAWEVVQRIYSDIQIADERVQVLLLETTIETELENDMDQCETYFKRYTNLRLRVEKFDTEMYAASEGNTTSQSSQRELLGKRQFKLPVIEFRKFGGDIREWLGFWAQFKKIHDDPNIDPHDKIVYLIQATVPGSKARQLVESYPAMQENYVSIIESLKARFGREDVLTEVYVRELIKLIINQAMDQEKTDICTLYDKIESHLRALEMLGVSKNNCASILFPLIESCLPENLLRAWQRSTQCVNSVRERNETSDEQSPLEKRLGALMDFLKAEVENEQRISLATESFAFNTTTSDRRQTGKERFKSKYKSLSERTATAAGLVNCDGVKCTFCEGSHDTESCFKAKRYSLKEKRDILSKRGACFNCLKLGHLSRKCHARIRCLLCEKSHVTMMCPEIPANRVENEATASKKEEDTIAPEQALACQTSSLVFMQTLRVTLSNGSRLREVRALMDTGSQRSYVLRSTARDLGYTPIKTVTLSHALFGGQKTADQSHNCYKIKVSDNTYSCTLEALDQIQICSNIEPIHYGGWIEELKAKQIHLSDVGRHGPIEVLFGADVIGKLYTGRHHILKSGLVAIDTLLGWTLMGKIPSTERSTSLVSVSMLVKDAPICDLWSLDVLGITEPTETKNRQEMTLAAKEMFRQTVTMSQEGRYEVRLPWIEGHPPLSRNYSVAKRRMDSTVKKLKRDNLLEAYDCVFKEWIQEEIIEEVPDSEMENIAHYLPHRAVVKDSSTTKIRPVFDASSCEKGRPSLNSCLEVGPNLIESIPSILLRFRMFRLGVVSDIRKAFLQISLNRSERDFLRFLWMGINGEEITYRHKRVVFGVNSSPFLLGATIEHHLELCREKCSISASPYTLETINKLSGSFYVDNCVTSVEDETTLDRFIKESITIMNEGSFDLRGWEYTQETTVQSEPLSVLGLSWDPKRDVLSINKSCIVARPEDVMVTKRQILSMAQKVFDPIGFTCPASLYPKLMLQKTWKEKLGWDEPVDEGLRHEFCSWARELDLLTNIEIPRCIKWGLENNREYSLHVFCDASKEAYAAVVYLRVKEDKQVFVYLLTAKARVAPLKKITIPRLELLAATIGARLYHNIMSELKREVECHFWSDSSTVISWIRRGEEWSTFTWNRVQEIRSLTSADSWRHVSGSQNPADLPSRGCSVRQLVASKWWEGPQWMYQDPELWPNAPMECDEEEIGQERKRRLRTMVNLDTTNWHIDYFSKYIKTVRMLAWIFRFKHNVKNVEKSQGELTTAEIDMAERFLFRIIQRETLSDVKDKRLCTLNPFIDEYGIIRLKSQVSSRKDSENFRFPVVLPSKHTIVDRLIYDLHVKSCHVGTQGLLCLLRERYWVLGGRRAVRAVIDKCVICRRHNSKPFEVESPPLPLDRVRDAVAFEITGVDFAGPLFLKNGNKAWVCLFTCAVYRAVHLELTTSLSTPNFIQVMRRFVARRGRPRTIYSDNGRNFVGTENAFSKLDWEEIGKRASVERITWRFNPPTAAWWGGFWERLIGVMKRLLRKVLGRASLNYEDLLTSICDCEAIINARPLTYMSEDTNDLVAITPAMFLRDQVESGVPDCDEVTKQSLCRKIQYKQKLRDDLRRRFRSEYLGQLKTNCSEKSSRQVTLGEVVLIGNDNEKRLDWPLGRVVEILPGKDNRVRLVRVNSARGQFLRPVQRIYPLECISFIGGEEGYKSAEVCQEVCSRTTDGFDHTAGEAENSASAGVTGVNTDTKSRVIECPIVNVTRSGRRCRLPERFL